MKPALLLFLVLFVFAGAHAQVAVNRTMAMVEKATATWCGPCGTWGWTLQEDIAADNMVGANPNAFVLEAHGSLGSFHTGTADSLIRGWVGSSIPKWAVNNVNRTVADANGIYPILTRTAIKKAVDSLVAISPVASTGFYYTITGNTINFRTQTRFWKAASGTYNLGVYIIEDSAFGEQVGQATDVYHRNVLRGRISSDSYGDQIATGTIGANQTYSKNFTFTITRTDWNKSRLIFLAVLWKKNGSNWDSWEVVNANSVKSIFNGVDKIPLAVDQLIVYPNPATDRLHLSGALTVAADAGISIINAIGQTVFQKTVPYHGGQLSEDIKLDKLSNGVYTLLIRAEDAQSVQKIIIAK